MLVSVVWMVWFVVWVVIELWENYLCGGDYLKLEDFFEVMLSGMFSCGGGGG